MNCDQLKTLIAEIQFKAAKRINAEESFPFLLLRKIRLSDSMIYS